jgi:hypothetical protein
MSHIQDAIRQWVWVAGADCPDCAWLLSDYDSWEANPHYVGPPQRHPEDYDADYEEYADGVEDPGYEVTGCENGDYVYENDYDDDIPF